VNHVALFQDETVIRIAPDGTVLGRHTASGHVEGSHESGIAATDDRLWVGASTASTS
jgi:hypothetical protein